MGSDLIFAAIFLGLFFLLWLVFLAAAPPMRHLVKVLANRTARFRFRDYSPVVVLLVLGTIGTAIAADAFVDVAERVQANSPALHGVDTKAHQWAAAHRTPGSTAFFVAVTTMGGPAFLVACTAIVAIGLVVRGRYRWAAYLVITTGIGWLLMWQLKLFFARARPDLAAALRMADGYSFPSGHAMGSAVTAGALCYLALRSVRSWRAASAVLAFATSFIVAVAFSRVYLGVHWISDVGAGVVAGVLWVTTATVAYEAFRRIRLVRSLRAQRTSSRA